MGRLSPGADRRRRWLRLQPSTEDFRDLCAHTGASVATVAEVVCVTERTVRYWLAGKRRVPYAAFRLVRLLFRRELPDDAWQG